MYTCISGNVTIILKELKSPPHPNRNREGGGERGEIFGVYTCFVGARGILLPTIYDHLIDFDGIGSSNEG